MLAETHMSSVAETDVAIARAIEPEAEGLIEFRFVAVAGWVGQIQQIALFDRAFAQHTIGSRRAHEMFDRRRPADRFFNESRNA